MRGILENQSKEKLIDFIIEFAEKDAKCANTLSVRFGKPGEFGKELNKIKNKIDTALNGVSDYRYHDSWGYVDIDVDDIIEEINQRVEQGHIRLAFAEIELLYCKLIENFEYQGECEISDEAENCLEIMSEIADKAVLDNDKDYIFKQCIALADLDDGKDYGADYEDKLLLIAAKFATPENRTELEAAIELFDSGWREEEFNLIRLEVIRRIEGEKAANSFIAENLRFTRIREIAYNNALINKDYSECECLCLDALVTTDRQDYGISQWLYKLYDIYEATENKTKMSETAQKILLCGDLKYYDKLKSLLRERTVWDDSYPELLSKCKQELPYQEYMEILAKEKEYALLLEQVKNHTEQIYLYGKLLAEKYRSDVCEIFTAKISSEAEKAYGRDEYQKVCVNISSFADAGYKSDAIEMINEFKLKYKRKPAFVDELKKID